MGVRRRARESALQMLFQYDIAQPTLPELLTLFWEELTDEPKEDIQEFATALVTGVLAHLDEIDLLIRQRTEHWRISRMAVVDRNLLRLAVYEFLFEADTPKTVVINEALEIARRFSTYEATQFINGILDGIKRDLEENKISPPPESQSSVKTA
ncbi:MAG: transcription antitermination factor NusB [Blastocatellia bacterium]|nr:transcription antitermination factor NusB [Blastocatellia bacterium]